MAVDGSGHVTPVLRTEWQGRTIIHIHEFQHVKQFLDSFGNYVPRQDDVWITSFPKTGKATPNLFRVVHRVFKFCFKVKKN